MTQAEFNFNSNIESCHTQAEKILAYMQAGYKITPLESLDRFQCMRLGARVHDLRKRGYDIKSEMVKVPSGKRVKQYWLELTI